MAGSGEETQLHALVLLQLLLGQTDDISGVCPEQAAQEEGR